MTANEGDQDMTADSTETPAGRSSRHEQLEDGTTGERLASLQRARVIIHLHRRTGDYPGVRMITIDRADPLVIHDVRDFRDPELPIIAAALLDRRAEASVEAGAIEARVCPGQAGYRADVAISETRGRRRSVYVPLDQLDELIAQLGEIRAQILGQRGEGSTGGALPVRPRRAGGAR